MNKGGSNEHLQHSQFSRIDFDVTDWVPQAILLLTCPMHFLPLIPGVIGIKTLVLEAEEARLEVDCCWCSAHTRRPYGELGSVDQTQVCCFSGIASDLTKGCPLCPRYGCDRELVSQIASALKGRQQTRGDQVNKDSSLQWL